MARWLKPLALCLLALSAPQAGAQTATTQEAVAAARLVSRFRAANGLGAVRVDIRVNKAAAHQSVAMAAQGVMSHEVAGDFAGRMAAFGVALPAAENISMGYATLAGAMEGWIASPGHRDNLLNASVSRIGLAYATDAGGRPYWTLILAR